MSILGRENYKCQGLEARVCLAYLRNSRVAGTEWTRWNVMENGMREVRRMRGRGRIM